MNTAQRRTEILKLLQQEEKPVAAQGDGITVWSKQTGDRAGYGCDTCIYTGNPVNDQRICVAAG